MNNIRSKAAQNRYSGADATDYSFNQYAGGMKVMGLLFGRVKTFMGALNTAKQADAGALVAVFNNSTSAAFVKTGADSSVTAPTGGTDGIAIPPNSYLMIPMGTDNYIISSAATVFGYWLQDDLNLNPNSGSNN